MSSREFQERLSRRAKRVNVPLQPGLAERLEVYYRLLATWNRKINLTGLPLDDVSPEALDRLLIEPLIAARHVAARVRRAIDIGSGGGSPALPLALALGELSLLMVESKTRKSVFLRESIRALELEARCEVATARFEELFSRPQLHEAHDLLTIRAVRVESRVLMGLQAFVEPGGEIFLFRSNRSTAPGTTAVAPPLAWKATYPLLESQSSCLVVLEKLVLGRQDRTMFHVKHR